MISTEQVREQTLTDPEARQEDIVDVHPRKRDHRDASRNIHVQEVLIASRVLHTIEPLHPRDEILLRKSSAREA